MDIVYDMKDFWEHFSAKNVGLLFLKTGVNEFVFFTKNQSIPIDQDASSLTNTIARNLSESVFTSMSWYLAQVTIQRSVEKLILIHVSKEIANKLTKDVSKSAIRKSENPDLSKVQSALYIIKTDLVSMALYHSTCFVLINIRFTYRKITKQTNKNYLEFLKERVIFRSGRLLSHALGASFGTFILPGTGTHVGSLVLDSLFTSQYFSYYPQTNIEIQ